MKREWLTASGRLLRGADIGRTEPQGPGGGGKVQTVRHPGGAGGGLQSGQGTEASGQGNPWVRVPCCTALGPAQRTAEGWDLRLRVYRWKFR